MNEKTRLPVTVASPVIRGRGIGHSLGAPTVNQELTGKAAELPYGVYFSRCTVGGKTYNAVTNIGVKPTVSDGGAPVAETHLLDCEGDLYGLDAVTELLVFRRAEAKFPSAEALSRAIAEDVCAASEYFAANTSPRTLRRE